MRGSSDRPEDRNARESSGRTPKKPYRPPHLVKYGSLSQLALTSTKGGTKNDGAVSSRT